MEKLIEPQEISQEILQKLGEDYIRRYQLKQSIDPNHFKADTLFLTEQLRLYSRSIRQIRPVHLRGPQMLIQEKFSEVVFKVLQCLAKVVEKLVSKFLQLQPAPIYEQPLCDLCRSNMHSKKIQNIQRQIFDFFPVLVREDLKEKDTPQIGSHTLQSDIMSEQGIRKKMLALQRNLEERQSGLERSIEEFESFRNDLIIGLPRLGTLDFGNFNIKQHAFQMGTHFHTYLKAIQNKISGLKAVVRKTEEQSVQCYFEDADSTKTAFQFDSTKASSLRGEAQLKKQLQIKSKLQQSLKISQNQLALLRQHLAQLEQKNIELQQQFYLQKTKKVPKERHKPIPFNWEQRPRKEHIPETFQPSPSPQTRVADYQSPADDYQSPMDKQISTQIAQIRSEIESSGAKIEQFVPILKNSVKRAIDHFISHRMSSNLERRKPYTNEEDSVDSTSKKIFGSSFKRVSNFQHRNFKNPTKPEVSSEFSITTQLSYKIVFHDQLPYKQISNVDEKFLEVTDIEHKKAGSSFYKKSLQKTQGNLKPKRLKTTLSSVSSELKLNLSVHESNKLPKNEKLHQISHFPQKGNFGNLGGQFAQKGKNFQGKLRGNLTANGFGSAVDNISGNMEGLYLGESAIPELMQSKVQKFSKYRRQKKNISCQDLRSLWRKQELKFQDHRKLIQIKKIDGKKIPNELLVAFLEPKGEQECKNEATKIKRQHKKDQLRKNQKKDSKRQMAKVNNTSKQSQRKDIMTLKHDEISFLTYFFTLFARAHVSNLSLYSELRQYIFCPLKKEKQPQHSEDSMLRELIIDIIVEHRKCRETKQNQLCQHLHQFIDAFQSCVD